MYRLGHRQVHHYLLYLGLLLVALLLVGSWLLASKIFLQPHTVLNQAAPVTHTVTADGGTTQPVTTKLFTMQLPSGWHAVAAPHVRYTVYSWAGGGDIGAARRLDVYVDDLPSTLAVNRLLPVAASGSSLEVTGAVSDNCVNFTDKTSAAVVTSQAPSKWSGVNFLCDMGNYERDVIGIGSVEGINRVTLIGPHQGMHRLFLTYTDNNVTPDYSVIINIVKSFHLL